MVFIISYIWLTHGPFKLPMIAGWNHASGVSARFPRIHSELLDMVIKHDICAKIHGSFMTAGELFGYNQTVANLSVDPVR